MNPKTERSRAYSNKNYRSVCQGFQPRGLEFVSDLTEGLRFHCVIRCCYRSGSASPSPAVPSSTDPLRYFEVSIRTRESRCRHDQVLRNIDTQLSSRSSALHHVSEGSGINYAFFAASHFWSIPIKSCISFRSSRTFAVISSSKPGFPSIRCVHRARRASWRN